jgi:hypothetical protein
MISGFTITQHQVEEHEETISEQEAKLFSVHASGR